MKGGCVEVNRADALAEYRRVANDLAKALLRGEDPSFACSRERATLTDDPGNPWKSMHACSEVIAKHNPIIAASMRLYQS